MTREDRLHRLDTSLRHCASSLPGDQRLPEFIKLTGTSGKGSVAAMLEATMIAAGKRVGIFTSPHLCEPSERIRINGQTIRAARLDAIERSAASLLDGIDEELGAVGSLSFFTTMFVLAVLAFAEDGVEVAIIEAGIGGHYDSTSRIPAGLAAITSVGIDHAGVLGPTIADIARNKAGIASDRSTLVLGPGLDADAEAAIVRDTSPRGVRIVKSSRAGLSARSLGVHGHEVRLATSHGTLEFHLPLAGDFQLDNLATVACLISEAQAANLELEQRSLAGVAHTRWPGRLEFIPGSPGWLLDCAHNELALRSLADFVRGAELAPPITLMLGATSPDVARQAIEILAPLVDRVRGVEGFHRATPIGALLGSVAESPEQALDSLLTDPGSRGTVIVTGSLFLVGRCRAILSEREENQRR